MNNTKTRISLGILIAPWLYVMVWTAPLLEHSAFHKWIVINTVLAYAAFFVLAGLSHVVLRKIKATKIWSYCIVMFALSVLINLVLSLWSLSGYTSNYYAQTQVVLNGSITSEGYILQVKEALSFGIISSGVMAIFWFISLYKPKGKVINA